MGDRLTVPQKFKYKITLRPSSSAPAAQKSWLAVSSVQSTCRFKISFDSYHTWGWWQSEDWNQISCILPGLPFVMVPNLMERAAPRNQRLRCRNKYVRPWPKSRTFSMLEGVSSWCSQMLRPESRENKWTRKGCYALMWSNCMIYLLNGLLQKSMASNRSGLLKSGRSS